MVDRNIRVADGHSAEIVEAPGEIEFNPTLLCKGDVLDTAWCERHLGLRRHHTAFQNKLNRLGQSIMQWRRDLIVSTRGMCIRVLTDDEAEIELYDRARHNVRATLNTAALHARIDTTRLSDVNKALNDCMQRYHAARALEASKQQQNLLEMRTTHLAINED